MNFKNVLLLLLLSCFEASAQPAAIYGIGEAHRFAELTERLKAEPDNYEVIWERISMTPFASPSADLHRKPEGLGAQLAYIKDTGEVFDGLSKLIAHGAAVDGHTVAEFRKLRGKACYLSGQVERALTEYGAALKSKKPLDVPGFTAPREGDWPGNDIYLLIAACYYHRSATLTEENARLALQYLNLADPGSCHNSVLLDCLEQEKTELLTFLGETQQLLSYKRKLVREEYRHFLQIRIALSSDMTEVYGKNAHYFRTLARISELAGYYQACSDTKRAGGLRRQLLNVIPPNEHRPPDGKFSREDFERMESREYSRRFSALLENRLAKLPWEYPDLSAFVARTAKD